MQEYFYLFQSNFFAIYLYFYFVTFWNVSIVSNFVEEEMPCCSPAIWYRGGQYVDLLHLSRCLGQIVFFPCEVGLLCSIMITHCVHQDSSL